MEYISNFMNEHNFPQEAKSCLSDLYRRIKSDEQLKADFQSVCDGYMNPSAHEPKVALEKLRELCERAQTHEYTIDLLFWICCSETLQKRYVQRNIDMQIFFDTMEDLSCKLRECMQCEEIVGTFVEDWFHGFFTLERFAIGRFQYEISTLYDEYTAPDLTVIKSGSPCLELHIPSTGVPLTDDVRFDSYKKAYNFFSDMRIGTSIVFSCGSWLLYEKHREFLPENSNILKFMDDFDIVSQNVHEGFSSGWRVFGKDSDLPFEQLPDDTSLRMAYKSWLLKTGVSGDGRGVILFDTDSIVNRRRQECTTKN